ncbi:MAG: nitroreductase family protein [Treponema sp.]|jgi:nitroreductase/NAD-dependent dihydropyrimidine dehydrogenase PreA subunit|nr:nitroreductase family protein [Treponema sp.]
MKPEIRIVIDKESCTGCGACKADCSSHVIEIQNEKAVVLRNSCLKCGHCFAVCPSNAVKMSGCEDEIFEKSDKTVFLDEKSFLTHLKFRRSIRHYKNTPVEKEKLEKIIDAARVTPTARNMQNVRYIVVQNEIDALEDEVLKQYKKARPMALFLSRFVKLPYNVKRYKFERGFLFHKAPAVILVISQNEINACLAAMSMKLMAEALGLGTLYVGLFTAPANWNRKLRKSLGIARKEKIAACLALGYSDVQYLRSAPRKKAEVVWR